MSYDITCYRLKPGADIEAAAHADMPEEGRPDPRPIMHLQAAELRQAAAEIGRLWPGLEGACDEQSFEFDDLNVGAQFVGFQESVGVHVPYWREEAAARSGLQRIWEVLGMLERRFGMATYDRQLGRRLDLESDFDEVLRMIGFGTRALRSVIERRKPWWKFW